MEGPGGTDSIILSYITQICSCLTGIIISQNVDDDTSASLNAFATSGESGRLLTVVVLAEEEGRSPSISASLGTPNASHQSKVGLRMLALYRLHDEPLSNLAEIYNNVNVFQINSNQSVSEQLLSHTAVMRQQYRGLATNIAVKVDELEADLKKSSSSSNVPNVVLEVDPKILVYAHENPNASASGLATTLGSDDAFLNCLQKRLIAWKNIIRSFSNTNRDPLSGTVSDEVNFWTMVFQGVENIARQLHSVPVQLTFDLLREKRRFYAVTGFEADSGFDEIKAKSIAFFDFLRDLPIAGIVSANSISDLVPAIRKMFSHFKLVKRLDYPVARVLQLMQSLCRDVALRIKQLVHGSALTGPDFDSCDAVMSSVQDVVSLWLNEGQTFRDDMRELRLLSSSKQYNHDTLLALTDNLKYDDKDLNDIMSRISDFRILRQSYRDFRSCLAESFSDLCVDLDAALLVFRELDILNVSSTAYQAAASFYSERVDLIEIELEERLRGLLGQVASDVRAQFVICAQHKAILERPFIHSALSLYQEGLLNCARDAIRSLQDRFAKRRTGAISSPSTMTRDVPSIAGSLLWIRGVESSMDLWLSRVSDVLGSQWAHHVDGISLKHECDSFRQRIIHLSESLLDSWQDSAVNIGFSSDAPLFVVNGYPKKPAPEVNFNQSLVTLLQEASVLNAISFRIPYDVRIVCADARIKCPFATRLADTLRSYISIIDVIGQDPRYFSFASMKRIVQDHILECGGLKWGARGSRLKEAVDALCQSVDNMRLRLMLFRSGNGAIESLLQQAEVCPAAAISGVFGEIQQRIFSISEIPDFVNLEQWCRDLDLRIDQLLRKRIENAIRCWQEQIASQPLLTISVEVQNNALAVKPSLHESRSILWAKLEGVVSCFYSVPCLMVWPGASKLRDIKLLFDQSQLACLVVEINEALSCAESHLKCLLSMQCLLDLDVSSLLETVENAASCSDLLSDMIRARSHFFEGDSVANFFAVRVVSSAIRPEIEERMKDLESRLGLHLQKFLVAEKASLLEDVNSSRSALEQMNSHFATVPIPELCVSISRIQAVVTSMDQWQERLIVVERWSSHLLVELSPSIECVSSSLQAVKQILQLRLTQLQGLAASAISNIVADRRAQIVAGRCVSEEWNRCRPVDGNEIAANALNVLDNMLSRVIRIRDRLCIIRQAMQFFNQSGCKITHTEEPQEQECQTTLQQIEEEICRLREVWVQLLPCWSKFHDLEAKLLMDSGGEPVRVSLTKLQTTLTSLPNAIRLFEAHNMFLKRVEHLLSINSIVLDLQSPALRIQHHRRLAVLLFADSSDVTVWSNLTLQDVWSCSSRLLKLRAQIRDLVEEAQGENSLVNCMNEMDNELQTVGLNVDRHLVRNFSALATIISDQLSNLSSMRVSSYVGQLLPDINRRHDQLGLLSDVIQVWNDVQRRWQYLSVTLGGTVVDGTHLPNDCQRLFSSLDADYRRLLLESDKFANLYCLITDASAFLVRLRSMSAVIDIVESRLGSFLYEQRLLFPRLFFIGDRDLLEMLGHPVSFAHVTPHLSKMFAGVSSFVHSNSETIISGICSQDGESVSLLEAVQLTPTSSLQSWLTALESQIRFTISSLIVCAVDTFPKSPLGFGDWMHKYPAQVLSISVHVWWTNYIESSFSVGLQNVVATIAKLLSHLSENLAFCHNRKIETLVHDLIHFRNATQQLLSSDALVESSWSWQACLRLYLTSRKPVVVELRIAGVSFEHGFEYIGCPEPLVKTKLTEQVFTTLLHALYAGFGGAPFGPAGTGKTETVKALGTLLGRQVLVFNCDESFDVSAMENIFSGLCMCGAWGCFDEFNRLTEGTLSSLSHQIRSIQDCLRSRQPAVNFSPSTSSRSIVLNSNVGLFITINPNYAGRSSLPDNLLQLFRSVPMAQPDNVAIVQVTLFSQGFCDGDSFASCMVELFNLCCIQLSKQAHYDFGLRALKSVLRSAGELLHDCNERGSDEFNIILKALHFIILPKLVAEDVPLFERLLKIIFPDHQNVPTANFGAITSSNIIPIIPNVAQKLGLCLNPTWHVKIEQLFTLQKFHRGLILIGAAGSGKSTLLRIFQELSTQLNPESRFHIHILSPKSHSKSQFFGAFDPISFSWTDGIFTALFRRIITTPVYQSDTHWIVLDGSIDPIWAENLNSLLDESRVLCLPNGERLALPKNVRIIFEVETLQHSTPATVSRCGMIYFSDDVVTPALLVERLISQCAWPSFSVVLRDYSPLIIACIDWLRSNMMLDVMKGCIFRATTAFASLLWAKRALLCSKDAFVESRYNVRALLQSLVVSFTMGSPSQSKRKLVDFIVNHELGQSMKDHWPDGPDITDSISLLFLCPSTANWIRTEVVTQTLVADDVFRPDCLIESPQIRSNRDLCTTFLQFNTSFILCGPPGSGKSMLLKSILAQGHSYELVELSFSSVTTTSSVLKALHKHCVLTRTMKSDGSFMSTLRPALSGVSKLVLFCDEINLPIPDEYGSQMVLELLRTLIELGGYWDVQSHSFVSICDIIVVGACNPTQDAFRYPISRRLLRHIPILFVDVPDRESLIHIYSCYNRAILRSCPSLIDQFIPLTVAMVDAFTFAQNCFAPLSAEYPHYVYSPRDLTRWVRSILFGLLSWGPMAIVTLPRLIQLWLHEGTRLFCDRLVDFDSSCQMDKALYAAAKSVFFLDQAALDSCFDKPILFCSLIKQHYEPVTTADMRAFMTSKLASFREEVLDVDIVMFDALVEHVVRISRVVQQPFGHILLCGSSGSGKTLLSLFVCWMCSMEVVQIKLHGSYSLTEFCGDLRRVMRLAIQSPVAFIFDESNAVESGFLEQLNELLAFGEVPGLFEGNDLTALLQTCRNAIDRQSTPITFDVHSDEAVYAWFCGQVQRNVHVIFTMNPANDDFCNRVKTSPALFNRFVVDWFGDWSEQAFRQVAIQMLSVSDCPDVKKSLDSITSTFVTSHFHAMEISDMVRAQRHSRSTYVTPRHYVDLVATFLKLVAERQDTLNSEQKHRVTGLNKLRDTENSISSIQVELNRTRADLSKHIEDANLKLEEIMKEQALTERKRDEAMIISNELKNRRDEIATKQLTIKADLAHAEPKLVAARDAVQSIKKSTLDEIRAFSNPPDLVKLALEPTLLLLGFSADSWTDVRRTLRKPDFIPLIVNFSPDCVPYSTRTIIQERYLNNPLFSFENVNRASVACGHLVNWVVAQVEFSELLQSIAPLRTQLEALVKDGDVLACNHNELCATLTVMETRIETLKEEYADMIASVQKIKSEIDCVELRCSRSVKLIEGLGSERVRWEIASAEAEDAFVSLLGDSIIGALFVTYAGYYEASVRLQLSQRWHEACSFPIRSELSPAQVLSSEYQRQKWANCGLTVDDNALSNVVILEHCLRYPLLIDPAGQAHKLIQNKFNNFVKSRFSSHTFLKTLTNCLRFGNPLVIEDVEHIDPILNPILNRELHQFDGRKTVRIGDKDIDVSPRFYLIMTTRDPNARFTPDLCSRVTFINISVTHGTISSRFSYAIQEILTPSVLRKRLDLETQQYDTQNSVFSLEQNLLDLLSNSAEGCGLLDDPSLLQTLENIQLQTFQMSNELDKIQSLLREMKANSDKFIAISKFFADFYFLLQNMNSISSFYQFSVEGVLTLIRESLSGFQEKLDDISAIIKFSGLSAFSAYSPSLFSKDKLVFAFALCLIISSSDAQRVLEATKILSEHSQNEKRLAALFQFPKYSCLQENRNVSFDFCGKKDQFDLLDRVIISIVSDPHFIGSSITDYASKVLGRSLFDENDLAITSRASLWLCSQGTDVLSKVKRVAGAKTLRVVVLGSTDSYRLALDELKTDSGCLLLCNIHLGSPKWLSLLESAIHDAKQIQVVLSSQLGSSYELPLTLIRLCALRIVETSPSQALQQAWTAIDKNRCDNPPIYRARLHFLCAWLHSQLLERTHYMPVGWTRDYAFSSVDMECAIKIVDHVVGTSSSVSSDQFNAIRSLIYVFAYGGRVDTVNDQRCLRSVIDNVFNDQIFNADFLLFPSSSGNIQPPTLASTIYYDDFSALIPTLSHASSNPSILGLPKDSTKLISAQFGRNITSQILILYNPDNDSLARPSKGDWKSVLSQVVSECLSQISIAQEQLRNLTADGSKSDGFMNTYVRRERVLWEALVTGIAEDLEFVANSLKEGVKPCFRSITLVRLIALGIRSQIPPQWLDLYQQDSREHLTPLAYSKHVRSRVSSAAHISCSWPSELAVPLGTGFLDPVSYICSAKQEVSSLQKWPLDKMCLHIDLLFSQPQGQRSCDSSFYVQNVTLCGASWDIDQGQLYTDEGPCENTIPFAVFFWSLDKGVGESIPIYSGLDRTRHLCDISLPSSGTSLARRGVAIIINSNDQ